jgi:hypothetical protein
MGKLLAQKTCAKKLATNILVRLGGAQSKHTLCSFADSLQQYVVIQYRFRSASVEHRLPGLIYTRNLCIF